jgi:hypothetical protein
MQFLPLTQGELETTLLVLNRALERDILDADERDSVRAVLQKVGAGKNIEDIRHREEDDAARLAKPLKLAR